MSKPLVSQVFGKTTNYRMTLGTHESRGGKEIKLNLRVCLYEEYMAATHHLRRDLGRISSLLTYENVKPGEKVRPRIMGGTITRILPGNFSCEVEWDNGQRGIYFQKVLYAGADVPDREEEKYKELINSRKILAERTDLKRAAEKVAVKELGVGMGNKGADEIAKAEASHMRWNRWRPN